MATMAASVGSEDASQEQMSGEKTLSLHQKAVLDAISSVLSSLHPREKGGREEETLREVCRAIDRTDDTRRLFSNFATEMVHLIEACTHKLEKLVFTTAKERALVRFHQVRVTKVWPLWKKLFEDFEIPEQNPVLVQSVTRCLFNEVLIKFFIAKATPDQPMKPPIAMSAAEENAIRYASGYVPLRLLKKFRKQDSTKAAKFVECLLHMAVEGDESSYYKYTQEWIRSIDRGGLFHVNDATFLFFCAVEIQTQHHLPSHLRQSTDHRKSKESLIQAISSDKDVLSTWNTMAVDISDENQANELLNLLIEQWITIRGFSLTATWLEQYKKASKQSTKKRKALRKEVSGAKKQKE